jgi:hypothetical protein
MPGLGELAGNQPGGHCSWQIPNTPHYLQGALGGGLLGAGLGYGAGLLGSRLLPRSWNHSKLPKTLAMLGLLAGTAPGLGAITGSALTGDTSHADALFDAPVPNAKSYQPDLPSYPQGMEAPAEFGPNPEYNPQAPLPARPSLYKVVNAAFDAEHGDSRHPKIQGSSYPGTSHDCPNDPIRGTVAAARFDHWRTRFGQPPGSGAGPT